MVYDRSELSLKTPLPSYRMFSYSWGIRLVLFPGNSTIRSLEMGKKNAEEFRSHLEK